MRGIVRRTGLPFLTGLIAPGLRRHDPRGPECRKCHKLVDYQAFDDRQSINFDGDVQQYDYCDFVIRCHGEDEVYRVEMGGREWRSEDAAKKLIGRGFFDPTQQLEAAVAGMSRTENEEERPERS